MIESQKNKRVYISDKDQILQFLCEFYEKWYTSYITNNSTVKKYLDNINLEYISNDKDYIELKKTSNAFGSTEAILSMEK